MVSGDGGKAGIPGSGLGSGQSLNLSGRTAPLSPTAPALPASIPVLSPAAAPLAAPAFLAPLAAPATFSPLAGPAQEVSSDRFICTVAGCKHEWRRHLKRDPIPDCPEHHKKFVKAT